METKGGQETKRDYHNARCYCAEGAPRGERRPIGTGAHRFMFAKKQRRCFNLLVDVCMSPSSCGCAFFSFVTISLCHHRKREGSCA